MHVFNKNAFVDREASMRGINYPILQFTKSQQTAGLTF